MANLCFLFQELDMTSTFVNQAARKLEQKPKSERREKKVPVQQPKKPVPDKPNIDPEEGKKVSYPAHKCFD